MRRNTSFVVLASLAVVLGLSLIPTTEAGRVGGTKVAPGSKSAAPSTILDRARLLERAKAQPQDQGKDIQPATAGLPNVLNAKSALSAALLTSLSGINTQFDEVSLIADWDGREDLTADHAQKVDDFSFALISPDEFTTRTGISEHTFANGFAENVYYYGDSIGNFWIGTDTNPDVVVSGPGIESV